MPEPMPSEAIPVLIIEDEREIQRFLTVSLEAAGYRPTITANAREGLQQAVASRPEIIILDLGLPDMDGKDVIRAVREWSQLPIIVLSARDREQEKIAALEAGADDYLTKPFGTGELLARMKVALRHVHRSTHANAVFTIGELKIDLAKRAVHLGMEEIHLTPQEYQLLSIMVKHAGKVITYSQLLKEIWGRHTPEHNNYLRIHMQHLRSKLKDDPLKPRYLVTEPGIGYRLRDE
ncbi:MAG: response regulator [Rickettsiales bacterium]